MAKLYASDNEVFEDYLKGGITTEELIQYGETIGREIATIEEIEQYLKNNTLIGYSADMYDVPKGKIIAKLSKLKKALTND